MIIALDLPNETDEISRTCHTIMTLYGIYSQKNRKSIHIL